ncbi:hypothetical protein [Methylorubrum zatmanii]
MTETAPPLAPSGGPDQPVIARRPERTGERTSEGICEGIWTQAVTAAEGR